MGEIKKSIRSKIWRCALFDDVEVLRISERYSVSRIIAQIMAIRGVKEGEGFIAPKIKVSMPSPYTLVDMGKGVGRIVQAVSNGETIGIIGDYDVDGATSCAIMHKFMLSIGIRTHVCIPDRFTDGYGPNIRMLQQMKDLGIKLCITLDCGTTSLSEMAWANDNGLEIIIIDHHIPDTSYPKCLALINPKRVDDTSGLGNLSAVGVAFLFIVAINAALPQQIARPRLELYNMLDMVALGTVCDVMSLRGLNRAYVAAGIKVMASNPNLGLLALMQVAGVRREQLSAGHLGFYLGPRINAGGRLGKSRLGFELLTSDSSLDKVMSMAYEANKLNESRGKIEEIMLLEAIEQINNMDTKEHFAMVCKEGWHIGVIGIVASRLVERFGIPVAVVAISSDEARASCRSIPGINFGDALIVAKKINLLVKGGGHAAAAGFSVLPDKIEELREFLQLYFAEQYARLASPDVTKQRMYDVVIEVRDITTQLLEDLSILEPYGNGNEQPRFMLEKVSLHSIVVLKERHMRFTIMQGSSQIAGIMFRLDQEAQSYIWESKKINLVGYPSLNSFNGRDYLQFVVEDIWDYENYYMEC